jgi:hypothetical protein
MALGSTQPLTEMRTRNLHEGKMRPARRADNLAECLKMWEPQPLASLTATTACIGITLPLPYLTSICFRHCRCNLLCLWTPYFTNRLYRLQ